MTKPIQNRTLSLGTLRTNPKRTKDNSPDVTGTISIKRELLVELHKQLTETGDDDVVGCLAGWFYDDAQGSWYMRVQLSKKPQRLEYRDESRFWDFH